MLPFPGSYENRRGALYRLNADREDLFREELATATTFFTAKERQVYDAVPDEISHRAVVQYFTLTPDELAEYPDQGPTCWVHMERIRKHLGYREFNYASVSVAEWLLPLALEHDYAHGLLDRLVEHLRGRISSNRESRTWSA